jgi:HPt (histidine-containing phosphotransfer) domain-containing protein
MMPAQDAPSQLPVDPEVLEMLADLQEPGEPDVLAELLGLFLRDTPERLGVIARALDTGDLDAVGRAAHSVKGSASNLGAMALQGYAACVEMHARTGDLAATRAEAAGLADEYRRVREHLESLRRRACTDGRRGALR